MGIVWKAWFENLRQNPVFEAEFRRHRDPHKRWQGWFSAFVPALMSSALMVGSFLIPFGVAKAAFFLSIASLMSATMAFLQVFGSAAQDATSQRLRELIATPLTRRSIVLGKMLGATGLGITIEGMLEWLVPLWVTAGGLEGGFALFWAYGINVPPITTCFIFVFGLACLSIPQMIASLLHGSALGVMFGWRTGHSLDSRMLGTLAALAWLSVITAFPWLVVASFHAHPLLSVLIGSASMLLIYLVSLGATLNLTCRQIR